MTNTMIDRAEFFSTYVGENFHPQLIIPEIAEKIGLEECIILQQLHYWTKKAGKFIDGCVWIYNTFEQWNKQFAYWSLSKVKRIFYSLESKGLIFIRQINKHNYDNTNWYALNYIELCEILKSVSKPKKRKKNKGMNDESHSSDKIFPSVQNELRSCQFDTVYNITETNLQKTTFLSNKIEEREMNFKERKIEKLNNKFINSDEIHIIYESKNIKSAKKIEKTLFSIEDKGAIDEMLKVWNDIHNKSTMKVSFTDKRGGKLLKIWNTLLKRDINNWKTFCEDVLSSKFLMGEKKSGFKACFDWLIDEGTAKRVINKDFGIGDRNVSKSKSELLEDKPKLSELQLMIKQLRQEDLKEIEDIHCNSQEEMQKLKKAFLSYMEDPYEKKMRALEPWKHQRNLLHNEKAYNYLLDHYKLYHYFKKDDVYYEMKARDMINKDQVLCEMLG